MLNIRIYFPRMKVKSSYAYIRGGKRSGPGVHTLALIPEVLKCPEPSFPFKSLQYKSEMPFI